MLEQKYIDRFWKYTQHLTGIDSCWPWLAAADPNGYGRLVVDGKHCGAHRIAWEIANGRPPSAKMDICHTCDNPGCVRPSHLFEGTRQQNLDDMKRKGRSGRGEKAQASKLTIDKIMPISIDERPMHEIAAQYGISVGTVFDIKANKTWRHVLREPQPRYPLLRKVVKKGLPRQRA